MARRRAKLPVQIQQKRPRQRRGFLLQEDLSYPIQCRWSRHAAIQEKSVVQELQELDFRLADVIHRSHGCAIIEMGPWMRKLLDQMNDPGVEPSDLIRSLTRLTRAGVLSHRVWSVIRAGDSWLRDNTECPPRIIKEGPCSAEVTLLDVNALAAYLSADESTQKKETSAYAC